MSGADLLFTHRITLPNGEVHPLAGVRFFSTRPPLALVGSSFYLLRNAPPPSLLEQWSRQPAIPVRKLSHRLLKQLRQTRSSPGAGWDQLCVAHPATPQFIFELLDDTVRVRLLARSERDGSVWLWNGHDWQPNEPRKPQPEKPEILDDPRLEPVTPMAAAAGLVHARTRPVGGRRQRNFFEHAGRGVAEPPGGGRIPGQPGLPPAVPDAAAVETARGGEGQRH